MSRSDIIEKLTDIISYIGGPHVSPDDLEWAVDLPAGRKLLEWLLDQVDGDLQLDVGSKQELAFQASFADIALEHEELIILNKAEELLLLDRDSQAAVDSTRLKYAPPSVVRSNIASMQSEVDLLESEARLLKHRLHHMKSACQKVSEAIKILGSQIKQIDSRIDPQKDRLAELSIKADAAAASSVYASQVLLRTLHSKPGSSSSSQYSKTDTLSDLSAFRSNAIHKQHQKMCYIQDMHRSLPDPQHITEESARLQEVFTGSTEPAIQALSLEIMVDMCQRLKDAESTGQGQDVLRHMIKDVASEKLGSGADLDGCGIDVNHRLQCAWKHDQDTILEAQNKILDETITDFEVDLIPSLTNIYRELSQADARVREAEALIRALIEELEEIVDDISDVKSSSASLRVPQDADDLLFENDIIDLLKRLHKSQPTDGPPPVLLERADIFEALGSARNKLLVGATDEEKWLDSLSETLSGLSMVHDPIRSALYKNSAVNTSLPLSSSPGVATLANDASTKIEELRNGITALQKGIDWDARKEQKLYAFVENWTRR